MFINTLKIHNFRNIKFKEFAFTHKVNVFHGENGVGKTSILESIYFLSTSKSFRKSTSKSIINFKETSVTVFSKCFNHYNNTLAISKEKSGKWSGKINNNPINKQSELSCLLQVIAIDPEVYRLIDFGPQYRRTFLDWFVFHVEHNYLITWKKTHKCIKQLNSLYKAKSSNQEILVWESSLAEFSEELHQKRKFYFSALKPRIISLIKIILPEINEIDITYTKGWQKGCSLSEQLKTDRVKNIKYGQLLNGPQKMDLKITANKYPASQTLSRGQKKILSIVFYLAYIEYLIKEKQLSPIVCLDDLDAEVDKTKLHQLTKLFDDLKVQLFISTVQPDKLKSCFEDIELFHVEHD